MVTANSNPMKTLYGRLSAIGLPRGYVRSIILPSWWDDEAADDAAGYAEALMLVSRHLGIRIQSLRDSSAAALMSEPSLECKFKRARVVSDGDVALAQRLAIQVARLAAGATTIAVQDVPAAVELRELILESGHPWLGLDALLDHCWRVLGIPVLHISMFPRGARKMDGLSAVIGGRPVIVISKMNTQPAWLLFILAHELGHIALDHVSDGSVLVDERVDKKSVDAEEQAANEYAGELLCGKPIKRFIAQDRWPNASELALQAQRLGKQYQIDPGHVVLNYADAMGKSFFPVGNAALRVLNQSVDAVEMIKRNAAENLDWSALPSDEAEFVTRMTGLEKSALV